MSILLTGAHYRTSATEIGSKACKFSFEPHTSSVVRETTKRSEMLADELRQLIGALARRLRAESAGHPLSHSEHAVLRRLQEAGPSTTAALARAEMIKPQSMGTTLASLEAAGFVARSADANDARCRNVSITAEGRRILAEGRVARQNWLARAIAENLDGTQQRTLLTALELLRQVVGS
jgi:DNA-binding MarR family transcriptional regulator